MRAAATAYLPNDTEELRSDAEHLAQIIMEMQRCFMLRLSKELAPGNVSFAQFFLLTYLDHNEVLTMSAIAQKMGHTTAAASGLVARLENLGYVMRSHASDDRRKVMVCITPRGSALVRRIREEMIWVYAAWCVFEMGKLALAGKPPAAWTGMMETLRRRFAPPVEG